MSAAKQAVRGKATAHSAGVSLHQMHRRARLGRWAVWAAVATGPLGLATAVLSSKQVVQAAPHSTQPSAPAAVPAAQDPAGFAEVFVGTWLRSSASDDDAQSAAAQSMAPDVPLPEPARNAQPAGVAQVSAVRSAQRSVTRWQVTVAATFTGGRVRYFAVPVASDRAASAFVVTAAPAEVAVSTAPPDEKSLYPVNVPIKGLLASTVQEFLSAYLCGEGSTDRYLAPGRRLTVMAETVYRTVRVQAVSADRKTASAERAATDGTAVRVQVQVEAHAEDGLWPLAYELQMTARAGRWEVSAVESGALKGVRS